MVNMDGLSDTSSSTSPVPSSARERSRDHPSHLSNNNASSGGGGGGGHGNQHHLLVDDPSLDASRMLEAALQQMDGIISGERVLYMFANMFSIHTVLLSSGFLNGVVINVANVRVDK